MKKKESDNMDEMANAGWQQMKALLDEKSPVTPARKPSAGKFSRLMAAIFFPGLLVTIFLWSTKPQPASPETGTSFHSQSQIVKQPVMIPEAGRKKALESRSLKSTAIKTDRQMLPSPTPAGSVTLQLITATETPSAPATKIDEPVESLRKVTALNVRPVKPEPATDNAVPENASSVTGHQPKDRKQGKWHFYAGAGINFSGTEGLTLRNATIHPGLYARYQINDRWSVFAGAAPFSALHSRYQNRGEKEYVNDLATNTFYNINTVSVVRVSYFDFPLYFQYRFGKQFSAGAGINISRLHKMRINDRKESFDYGNNLTFTNTERFTSNAVLFGGYEEKIDVLRWDNRLLMETAFETGRFRVSGGYAHGLKPSVSMLQRDGSKLKYTNNYIRLGLQYRLK